MNFSLNLQQCQLQKTNSDTAPNMSLDEQCQRLRDLVHNCISDHLYSSAIFYADKLVTLTNGAPSDVYLLAEVIITVHPIHITVIRTCSTAVLNPSLYGAGLFH